jgi:chromate transporter
MGRFVFVRIVDGTVIQPVSLWTLAAYFLRLGLTGFGGPVALANSMRRDVAERHCWISPQEYDEGLAIATAFPGPLAYKLGCYCGYVTHGTSGALTVAVAFAAAPFVIVVAIAAVYVQFGSSGILHGIFYGAGPVVIAIVARSCWDLGRKTLRSQWLAYLFAAVACAVTVIVRRELIALFLIAGALGIFLFRGPGGTPGATPQPGRQRPAPSGDLRAAAPALAGAYQSVAAAKIFWFFFKTGLLVFGSGLVIVPFLKAYVVDQYHWLSNQAFLDAVAVGIITPGPVVITATFVGFLNAGMPGAIAATAGMFLPSVVFVILGTPVLRRYRFNPAVQGFVRGITVAVVGVLLGTSYLIAKSTIHDVVGLGVLLAALAVLWSRWKIPEPALVGAGAAAGLAATLVRLAV